MPEKVLDWRAATKALRSARQKLYNRRVKGASEFKVRDLDIGYSTSLYALKKAIEEVERQFKNCERFESRLEIRYDKETDSPYVYAVRDHSAGRNRLVSGNK